MRAHIDLIRRLTESEATGLTIRQEVTAFYSGQMNADLLAYMDGKLAGKLAYSAFEGVPHISMIRVVPEFQRRGIATALLHELQREYPDAEIRWGMLSDDGAKLYGSMSFDDVPDAEVQEGQARLAELRRRHDELVRRCEEIAARHQPFTDEQLREMNPLWDEVNEISDEIRELDDRYGRRKPFRRLIRRQDGA